MASIEQIIKPRTQSTSATDTGLLGWVLQRVTAVLIAVFLGIHFWVLHFAVVGQRIDFARVADRLQDPWFIVVDLALLATVLYHGLNGVRAFVFDFGIGQRSQRILTGALLALGVVAFAVATWALVVFING